MDEQILEDRPVARAADDRLDSWKEIALYLNRDVRTVRRWEKNQGLPVRRHQHQKGASVFAYRSEIDVWRQQERERLAETPASDSPALVADTAHDHRNSWFVFGVIGLFAVVTISLLGYFRWRSSQIAMETPPQKLKTAGSVAISKPDRGSHTRLHRRRPHRRNDHASQRTVA